MKLGGKMKTYVHTKTCICMLITVLSIIAKRCAQSKCPFTDIYII